MLVSKMIADAALGLARKAQQIGGVKRSIEGVEPRSFNCGKLQFAVAATIDKAKTTRVVVAQLRPNPGRTMI